MIESPDSTRMKLYNTLTGDLSEFAPADGKTVKMYVCGVTPYSSTHVGHALSYVAFDVLRRYLEYLGYEVRHVQNFTDVDDKIIQRANDQGIDPEELAEQYIEDFYRGMDALNIQRAHVYPRATQEIGPIVETISTLIDGGYAYPVAGDVYFRVLNSPGYGKLGRRTLDSMQAGARVQVDENKEHPMDFALWKGARPGEPSWQSPWGPGRPGWHIECSSMSMTYLGESLDIHGGGQDLIFPHHENEIAQSEASTGAVPFSRYWVHNGLLQLGDDKMSKSLGNLVSLEDALAEYSPDTMRLYFLSSHYRSPLRYSDEGCAAMERSLDRLRHALRPAAAGEGAVLGPGPLRRAVPGRDERGPEHLRAPWPRCSISPGKSTGARTPPGPSTTPKTVFKGSAVSWASLSRTVTETAGGPAVAPFIELLLETRSQLRQAKQYEQADRIREGLESRGVVVEDTANGPVWEYRPPS